MSKTICIDMYIYVYMYIYMFICIYICLYVYILVVAGLQVFHSIIQH